LLLIANHKDQTIFVRGNEVKIKRGQVGWAKEKLAKRWGWSKNKCLRFLKWLKSEQQIELQKSAVLSPITIIRYEEYQGNGTTDGTTERPQKDHRRNANKNVKNDNNDKKDIYSEFVRLKKGEYSKLVEGLGEARAKEMIQRLNDYIGSTGKRYKSHYHTILNWVRKDPVPEKPVYFDNVKLHG
jgi:hypothetical protein